MKAKPGVAAPRAVAASAKAPKSRLAPADRERQIIDGAIAYFSEVGFSGQTRELSSRLGITQPLLCRYFASEQALVERVYQTVFEGRWNPAWIPMLQDRSKASEQEIEFVWNLHGGIFYFAMREHVYKARVKVDFMTHVGFAVDNFLEGAKTTYPRLLAAFAPDALAPAPRRVRRLP